MESKRLLGEGNRELVFKNYNTLESLDGPSSSDNAYLDEPSSSDNAYLDEPSSSDNAYMAGRFNVAKTRSKGGGGVDNPALDLGSMPTGLNINPLGEVDLGGSQDSLNRNDSFCHLTMEALPRADYYMNSKDAIRRPSIGELQGEPRYVDMNSEEKGGSPEEAQHHGVKLGWIVGVLIPCLLNIWGVMLFLRLSWVVGQAGILESLLIILASAVVCVLTTLSMSAICTNGEVKGGGIYYIISRSLGPEFGASVGVIFAFANAVAASMNTIGFCDSLNDYLKSHGLKIVDGGLTDVRIVGVISVLIMIIICAVGMEWESKAQNFLVVIIIAAIADFLIGSLIGPLNDEARAQGFTGFSMEVFKENWNPDYRYSENVNQNLFSVFAIFFPSVTGIQAGANISGDLKDPADAIPKGTLLSLLITMFSYALFVVFAGGAAVRDATGDLGMYYNGTYTNCLLTPEGKCQYGLQNSYSVMQLMSSWGLLIYAGCFAATLSTALTNLLSVPRLIQALGIDRIYPGLIFFSKGYGKNGEPYRGYVLTFIISALFVLIAEINVIAPLISNFYLASYALINFCTFHAALVRPLGWRPTFRYYNKWLSLVAFLLCIVIMFLIDWVTSIITFIVFFVLYLVVVYRNPNVNWGSSTQAQTYKRALMTMHKLFNQSEHVKNYQPQILLLVGQPQSRPPLVDLANLITRNNSLLVCAEISKQRLTYRQRIALTKQGQAWLSHRKVKGFFYVTDGSRYEVAARGLMQCSGVGRLKPNVLMMGYKSDWLACSVEDLKSYFNTLHDAFENRLAVTILRLAEGLDFSKPTDLSQIPEELTGSYGDLSNGSASASNGMVHNDSNLSYILSQTSLTIPGSKPAERPQLTNPWENNPSTALKHKKKQIAKQILHQYDNGHEISKVVLDNMMTFSKKRRGGIIDVWWLYDDGGLTILLPYIISTRSSWSDCQLRVFALANRTHELQTEEKGMSSLLAKFRIKYTSLKMIHNISDAPKAETISFFENLISGFRESNKNAECVVTDAEYETLKEKTYRQLRLRELLQQHSKSSTLVVMSLPMPRKGVVSPPLYMAWLEAITKDMPPFLLVRGNQTSVLTFYS